jgi:hypothetical protein
VQSVTINDLFSAGGKVAFHATQRGVYAGGLDGCDEHVGSPGELHLAGILDAGDEVTGGAIVRNRKDLQRTLAAVRTRA